MLNIDITKNLHSTTSTLELNINLQIQEHDFIAISGVSGSGKSTLLRILAGLESAQGEITFNDTIWQDKNSYLKTQHRDIGFVFQDYALFNNMSVEQNLLYVQKDKKLASHLLELTDLSALKTRLPHTLSGGQQQRVALCRALMKRPKLLLMDEPLSALDPKMRNKLQYDILRLHKEFKTTTIMVSHDPSEIYRLSSRVIVLENAHIINDGTPKEVLLKTKGSQKFSLQGEVLEIVHVDVIYIAIVSIAQQIVEVVIDESEAKLLKVGDSVQVSTKAFAPSLSLIS